MRFFWLAVLVALVFFFFTDCADAAIFRRPFFGGRWWHLW